MKTLAGITFDHHCTDCQQDTTVTIEYDEGTNVYGPLSCCGREVEALAVDITELLTDCGV